MKTSREDPLTLSKEINLETNPIWMRIRIKQKNQYCNFMAKRKPSPEKESVSFLMNSRW